MVDPNFQVRVTAKDDTAAGVGKAEKTIGRLPKKTAGAINKTFGQIDRATARSGRNIVSTFAQVERATVSAFGGGSRGIISGLSSLSSAGESAAAGMGEAAAAGGLLEGVLGAVAIGGSLVVGVIAGVAVVTDKLVTSWAKGVVGAANMAATVGIATKALQEFQAAGERAGIDKGASSAAIGGLSETLNNARFGKNATAAGTLAYLGIKMKLNPDGTVDTVGMLPQIEAAMSRQTSFGARQVAQNLGIPEGAIQMFRQKPGTIAADMTDAEKYAGVTTPAGEASARRWVRQRARVGQMVDHATDRGGAYAADQAQGVLDGAASAGAGMIDRAEGRSGGTIASGARDILTGAEQFSAAVIDDFRPAVEHLTRAIEGWIGGGRFSEAKVQRMANAALPLYRRFVAHGDSPEKAAAWAASAFAESGGDPNRQQPGRGKNLGYGLFQWDAGRRAEFRQVMGRDIHGSSFEDQLRFRDYELQHHESRAGRAIGAASGAAATADAITRFYERPSQKGRDAADRANVAAAVADAIGSMKHDVTVTVTDHRTAAHVRSRHHKGTSYSLGRSGD
ncbi:phage tail tip lysozyme [Sphingomonas sp. BE137]|uniref:phage tail tip lysozyme n=1 Tax=Sphingomonas sp. BE137 TaxID=2817844 RepID=UPI001AE5AA20|nr:phage tail tip lysozyme [Sphingomonas sp. BE137]MDR6850364.1 hypothetical protein [Sphingomonas sp. BE137]